MNKNKKHVALSFSQSNFFRSNIDLVEYLEAEEAPTKADIIVIFADSRNEWPLYLTPLRLELLPKIMSYGELLRMFMTKNIKSTKT